MQEHQLSRNQGKPKLMSSTNLTLSYQSFCQRANKSTGDLGVPSRGKTHPDTYNHRISKPLGAHQQYLSTLNVFEDDKVTRHSLGAASYSSISIGTIADLAKRIPSQELRNSLPSLLSDCVCDNEDYTRVTGRRSSGCGSRTTRSSSKSCGSVNEVCAPAQLKNHLPKHRISPSKPPIAISLSPTSSFRRPQFSASFIQLFFSRRRARCLALGPPET